MAIHEKDVTSKLEQSSEKATRYKSGVLGRSVVVLLSCAWEHNNWEHNNVERRTKPC